MSKKNLISIVVPCYNEEEAIPLFFKEINRVLSSVEDIDYELVFIDDGSSDKTLSILRDLSRLSNHRTTYVPDVMQACSILRSHAILGKKLLY